MVVKTKCLVFDLPTGAGGMAAGMYKSQLMKAINLFVADHKIDYVAKTANYKFKVWFNEDSHYTFFLLGFNWEKVWRQPYIINETYT